MSWAEAESFCTELGVSMVVVESEEERKEITRMTADLIKKNVRFWLDGRKNAGIWKTHQGSNKPTYTPWGSIKCYCSGNCIRSGPETKWYKGKCNAKGDTGGFTFNPLCKRNSG